MVKHYDGFCFIYLTMTLIHIVNVRTFKSSQGYLYKTTQTHVFTQLPDAYATWLEMFKCVYWAIIASKFYHNYHLFKSDRIHLKNSTYKLILYFLKLNIWVLLYILDMLNTEDPDQMMHWKLDIWSVSILFASHQHLLCLVNCHDKRCYAVVELNIQFTTFKGWFRDICAHLFHLLNLKLN